MSTVSTQIQVIVGTILPTPTFSEQKFIHLIFMYNISSNILLNLFSQTHLGRHEARHDSHHNISVGWMHSDSRTFMEQGEIL